MHYTEKMRQTQNELRTEVAGLRSCLQNIREYLALPKFQGNENNFVNPDDIRCRIRDGEARTEELINETSALFT